MADGKVIHYFGGGTSFMSNGYVIYRHGLSGDTANPYAVKQGDTYAQRMFYDRSMDVRSSFYKFIDYLQNIQHQEAMKETSYLENKMWQLKESLPHSYFEKVQQAYEAQNYSLMYTLLVQENKDLNELKRELNSNNFKNISHMNSFWGHEFSSYIDRVFNEKLEIADHKLLSKIDNESLSIQGIVDGYIDFMLDGKSGIFIDSLEDIRNTFTSQLRSYLAKHGIIPEEEDKFSIDDNLFTPGRDFSTLIKKGNTLSRNSKTKDRTLSGLVSSITNTLGNAVARGMSGETRAVVQQASLGGNAITLSTGTIEKELINALNEEHTKVQQKGDVVSFEVFNADVDFKSAIASVWEKVGNDTGKKMDALRDSVIRAADQQWATQIFEIVQNVKGYRSKGDFTIEQQGSFASRVNNLRRISSSMPEFSAEKLIFMLNNCVEGAINENRQKYVNQYISAICVAWMFDDYTDMLALDNMDEKSGLSTDKIHIFSANGNFYTASGIIQAAIDNLMAGQEAAGDSLVSTEIKGVPYNEAESYYKNLKSIYPVEGKTTFEEFDSQLKNRWDAMRDYIQTKSTVAIKIRQAQIEKLVDNLSILATD